MTTKQASDKKTVFDIPTIQPGDWKAFCGLPAEDRRRLLAYHALGSVYRRRLVPSTDYYLASPAGKKPVIYAEIGMDHAWLTSELFEMVERAGKALRCDTTCALLLGAQRYASGNPDFRTPAGSSFGVVLNKNADKFTNYTFTYPELAIIERAFVGSGQNRMVGALRPEERDSPGYLASAEAALEFYNDPAYANAEDPTFARFEAIMKNLQKHGTFLPAKRPGNMGRHFTQRASTPVTRD